MAFLRDFGGTTIDRLLKHEWGTFFHVEPIETWDTKFYSLINENWTQFIAFYESHSNIFHDYWFVCPSILSGALVLLAIRKSVRYLRAIEYRERNNSREETSETNCQGEIVSTTWNGDEHEEGNFVEPCPTFSSDLQEATITGDNNDLIARKRTSSVSSEITIVPDEVSNEADDFLISLIESMIPDDGDEIDIKVVPHIEETIIPEGLNLQNVSTLEKIDSANCAQFYVLTPWIETVDRTDGSERLKIREIESGETLESAFDYDEETENAVSVDEDASTGVKNSVETETETTGVSSIDEKPGQLADSTLITERKDGRENLESTIEDRGNSIASPSSIGENPEDKSESHVRTDSKHRFRSLSQNERTVFSAACVDARRGNSVSPPSRSRNKSRSAKPLQSKIPTLSPPIPGRPDQLFSETEDSMSEAANQIRTVVLRKLREVWMQHPRDLNSTCKNWKTSPDNESKTPQLGSKIPLLRKSPRERP